MRKLHCILTVATAAAFLNPAGAALSIEAGGSGMLTFGLRPAASEWSTKSIPGLDVSFVSSSDLEHAIQTNASAASINNQLLDASGANPPGQNTLAAWTLGSSSNLWTRPTANGATLLMATLQNDTGGEKNVLQITYTLGQSGGTPPEQAPAHQVYYSLTGALGSWVNIPALSGGSLGARSASVNLTDLWPNGATLYVLWADDNATGGVDRGHSIDTISFLARKLAVNPPPVLTIGPTDATHAEIKWPASASTYVLESAPGLGGTNTWTALGAAGQYPSSSGFFRTNLTATGTLKFFRLRQP